jgi:hypothetical protein
MGISVRSDMGVCKVRFVCVSSVNGMCDYVCKNRINIVRRVKNVKTKKSVSRLEMTYI